MNRFWLIYLVLITAILLSSACSPAYSDQEFSPPANPPPRASTTPSNPPPSPTKTPTHTPSALFLPPNFRY